MADLDVAVTLKFLTTGADKLKTAARDLQAFGKIGNKATGRFGGDMTKAWTASVKLGGALNKSAGAANKTAAAIRSIGGSAAGIDKTRAAVDRLTKSTSAAAVNAKKMRSGALGAAMLGGGAMGRRAKMREGLAEAASRITPEGYLLGASGAVVAGAGVGGTIAGVGAAMAYGTKQAIDFEKAMANVRKKVNVPAGGSIASVEQMINRTAVDIGMSRTDMAELAATAGQAGIAYQDLSDFMTLAAQTSSSWDISARDAASGLAQIKAQTQWAIPKIRDFADQVNAMGDSSAASEKNVFEMFMRSAAAAKAANVPFETTLAVTTALNSIGMVPETAARFWNAFSSKMLVSGGRGAKDAAEGFSMLGLSLQKVQKGMKKDATGTIIDFLDRLEKSPNKAEAAIKTLGQEWWDEAARSGQALPEMLKNLKILRSGSWKGSLQQAQQIDLSTTAKQLERTKAMVSEIGDGLMRWSLPPINAQLQKMIDTYRSLKTTGFLPGADGKPIDRVADKTPIPFSPANRARFMGSRSSGESGAAYESRLRLDQPIKRAPAPPMISMIEGVAPHMKASKINADLANIIAQANLAKDALAFTASPTVNAAAAIGQISSLVEQGRAAQAATSFVSTPTVNIGPAIAALQSLAAQAAAIRNLSPTISGGGRAPSGGGGSPANPSAAGKQGSVTAPIHIGQAHFHGVRDPGSLHRQLAVLQNRSIRTARDGALHDIA